MLWLLMYFWTRIRVQPRAIAFLVLAAAVLACGFAGQAMAGSMGQNCFGPACEDQIGCSQPAQPQASPGSSVHLVAFAAAVELGLVFEQTEAPTVGAFAAGPARQPVAPLVPRAPPAV